MVGDMVTPSEDASEEAMDLYYPETGGCGDGSAWRGDFLFV